MKMKKHTKGDSYARLKTTHLPRLGSVIKPILDDKINEFVKKYNLTLNID